MVIDYFFVSFVGFVVPTIRISMGNELPILPAGYAFRGVL